MQVKTNDIKSVTAGNPLQALQGRAPGVSVMTNNIPGESQPCVSVVPVLLVREMTLFT